MKIKMDNILFPFPCLIVLLGLVLTSMTTAQNNITTTISPTKLINHTGNQVNSTINPVDTAQSNDTTTTLPTNSGSPNTTTEKDDDKSTNISTTTSQQLTQNGNTSHPSGGIRSTTPAGSTKDKELGHTKTTTTTTVPTLVPTTSAHRNSTKSKIWLIILIIIIAVVLVIVFVQIRKKLKRKSMDLPSRQEDVPLSTHDHDVAFDSSPAPKEMQTFTAVDLDSTEALVEDSPGTKEDGGNSSDLPPPPGSVDKPHDVAPTKLAPEHGALGVPEGETDDELAVSNKTSVESVAVNDDNNNNNNNIRMPVTTRD
ncbi:uncharacterized protein LOC105020944 isoform X2 [Esox lucius]|nr:uncharacterized protein LOC105020944 isoform X2 [Esox lucius]